MNVHQSLTDTDSATPEHATPPAEVVLEGNPSFTKWSLEDDGTLACGVWQATPGKWIVDHQVWEYVTIHSGHAILTPEGGDPFHLRAGDRHVLRPGLKCTWDVRETITKDYVIIRP